MGDDVTDLEMKEVECEHNDLVEKKNSLKGILASKIVQLGTANGPPENKPFLDRNPDIKAEIERRLNAAVVQVQKTAQTAQYMKEHQEVNVVT